MSPARSSSTRRPPAARWLEQVLTQRRTSGSPLVEVAATADGTPVAWSYEAVLDAAVALAWELRGMSEHQPRRLRVGLVAGNGVD